jgi:aspartate aminotransferase-like enzyme
MSLFAESPANTLTSIRLPPQVDGKALLNRVSAEHGMVFAGGQEHLAGRIVRIAHLGWMDDYDALVAVAAFERVLAEMGVVGNGGAGVQAAQVALGS